MTLAGGGLRTREDFQRDVLPIGPELINQIEHPICFEPAIFSYSHQDRAFQGLRQRVLAARRADRSTRRDTTPEKIPLQQIPNAAIANCRGKTLVHCDSAGDKRGASAISENRYSCFVNVLPR